VLLESTDRIGNQTKIIGRVLDEDKKLVEKLG
jgi:hypothetical protein